MKDVAQAAGAMSVACRFPFGLNKADAIAQLREIADQLERGDSVLQFYSRGAEGFYDDFALESVVLKFAPRNEQFDPARKAASDGLLAEYDAAERRRIAAIEGV